MSDLSFGGHCEGRMALKKKEIIAAVAEAAAKEAERFGLEIWDVEYVKEGPAYVLRIYID